MALSTSQQMLPPLVPAVEMVECVVLAVRESAAELPAMRAELWIHVGAEAEAEDIPLAVVMVVIPFCWAGIPTVHPAEKQPQRQMPVP
jgi:hypothetical protein